ncbi:MAG: hypothetical protein K0S41_834 [Anaerocolumna sp.]|jgi:hypothetical protein|nr:hypothetical protein [Anaerocolumna sp.]
MNQSYKNLKYFLIIGIITIIAVIIISIKQSPKDNSNIDETNKVENINETESISTDTYKATDETILNSDQQTNYADDSNLVADSTKVIDENIKNDINKVIKEFYKKPSKINKDIIAGSSEKEKKETVESILKKREGIEEFKNITSYFRAGLDETSYVVFITYDTKFKNINTLAPGMSVLYILQNEESYEIVDNIDDAAVNDYVIQLTKEDEIKDLIDTVNTKLKEAMESDKELKTFVEKLESVSE